MPTKKPRFTITVSDEMMEQITQFCKNRCFKNQNSAVVELVRCGLETYEKQTQENSAKETQ